MFYNIITSQNDLFKEMPFVIVTPQLEISSSILSIPTYFILRIKTSKRFIAVPY